MKSQRRFTEVSVALSFVILTTQIFANPVGGTISRGSGRIDRTGPGTLTIHQDTDRLVINWRDFSIAHGETTRFIQPSASSIALNRVIGGNPSKIFGTLEANGKVYVINQNGIMVGRSGVINTRGFVATTLDVSDASFMSRAKLTLSGNSEAAVVNEGSIQAIGGDVFLVARNVENSGAIRATEGTVGLAAGNEVVIVPTGAERITVIAGGPGARTDKGVNNLGTVEAVSAELKAAGGNIYALAVNNGGIVRATGVHREGGRVFLTSDGGNIENSGLISAHKSDGSGGSIVLAGGHNASQPATVVNSGTIEARGEAAGTKGGDVQLTGDHVGLFGSASVDASGDSGGGTALIGGDYQGANARVQNAQRTFVGDEAVIKADALAQGNGGKVVVWSDEVTRYSGSISARGGASGGNGGLVEVSGKEFLGFNGHADVGALFGLAGTILLDPQDVVIQDTGANDALLADSTLAFAEPDITTDVTISDDVLEALTGNVLVQAHRNLTIDEALTFANQTSGETVRFVAGGDLDINAAVVTAGADLFFTASDAGGINSASATLTVDAQVGDADTGAISFVNDGSGGIAVNAAVRTGNVSIPDAGGNSDETAASGGISVNSGGAVTLAGTGSFTTGSAQVTGTANSGDDTARSGNITITAAGAVVLNGNLVTGGATVGDEAGNDTATTGNVSITAGTSITGSGTATTGNAIFTAGTGQGANAATSGDISLTAGNGAVAGGIGLSASSALTTGSATGSNPPDPGSNDEAKAGSIILSSLDEINNGSSGSALSLGGIGVASGATINTPGTFRATTTGAGGNIFITSAADLLLGALVTAGGSAQTVSIGTTGGAGLNVGDNAESLAGDTITFDAGTGTLAFTDTDFSAGSGSLVLGGNEVNLTGGNDSVKGTGSLVIRPGTATQNIEIAGAGGTAALDLTASELAALANGFSSITIGRSADASGTLTVAAAASFNDNLTLIGGSIALNNSVSSAGNSVTLVARTGNITDGNAAAANVVASSLSASAQTGINLDTDIDTLTLATTVSGDISVEETTGNLAVDTVSTPGNVTLIAAGAITDANGVSVNVTANGLTVTAGAGIDLDTALTTLTTATAGGAGDIDINDLSGDLAVGSVTASGDSVTLTSAGAITDANGTTANIVADDLTVLSQTGIDLDTTIITLLNANVAAAGNINISDTAGGLAVTAATTADGNITLNATGGNLALTTVTANGTAADVALSTTTSGNVAVDSVTASGNTVTITSAGSVTDANGASINIVANSLNVSAVSGIDLDTTVNTLLNAVVTAAGNINVANSSGLIVTAATASNGNIDITSGGALNVTSASTTTGGNIALGATGGNLDVASASAGGNGDITLTTTTSGNVNVGTVTATGDSVSITSAGSVTDANGAGANVLANDLNVSSQTGIDLDTTITTLVNASVAGTGNIDISDTGGGLAVTLATTADGNITFNAASGNLDVTTATAGAGGDIQLTTTTSGDVRVGSAVALGDTITVTSAGSIEELGVPDAGAEFAANDISLTAQNGIGTAGTIETDITTLTLASILGAGNLAISDADALIVTAATAANGNINISAGGVLTVNSVSTTTDGNITLGATGGNLDVTTATANGAGDITLTTTTSGDVNVGNVTAAGDTVTVTSAGQIAELGPSDPDNDITGATVSLTAATSIGSTTDAIETDAATLNAAATAGGIFVREANALTLASATAGTDVNIVALGNLTVGSVNAVGNVTLVAQGGSVLDDNTAAGITAGGITDVSSTTGDIGSTAAPLDIINPGGAVNLTATVGGIHVDVDSAGNDDVNFTASTATQTTFDQNTRTFTLRFADDLTVETDGNVTSGAGVTVRVPGTLTVNAGGNIGSSTTVPLLIDANTLAGTADRIWVRDSTSLTLGNLTSTDGTDPLTVSAGADLTVGNTATVSGGGGVLLRADNGVNLNGTVNSTGDRLLVIAENTVTLTGTANLNAGASFVVLAGKSPVGPGISVAGNPNISGIMLVYAQSAKLTDPVFVENENRIPGLLSVNPANVLRGIAFDETDPTRGLTASAYIFKSTDEGINDPSLFIDIPVEVFQPVSIVFGDYDPTKFGEVGDLWMSSSELYEIERKAGKAPKALPPQVGRPSYIPGTK